jgi:large subunit ribosomal protein L29
MRRKEQLDRLKELSVAELREEADRLKESLFRLKFKRTLGVGQTTADVRREKKTLARVNTMIRQKEAQA